MLVSAAQHESATSIHCPLPPRPCELYKQALGRSLPLPSPRSLQQRGVTVRAAVKQPCGNAYTRVLLVACSPGLILAHCMGSQEEVPGQGGIVTIWAWQGSRDLEAVTALRQEEEEAEGTMLAWAGPRWLCFPRAPASTSSPPGPGQQPGKEKCRSSSKWAWGSDPSWCV